MSEMLYPFSRGLILEAAVDARTRSVTAYALTEAIESYAQTKMDLPANLITARLFALCEQARMAFHSVWGAAERIEKLAQRPTLDEARRISRKTKQHVCASWDGVALVNQPKRPKLKKKRKAVSR